MEFKTKRLLSFIIVGGYLFLGGCEYAVIFPTAWDYLQKLGVTDEYWLGFTVSAYSLSAAISGVIGGRLSDIYETQTKNIAMVSIVLMAIGNIQYTLGINVWNIFVARLICGVGTAAGSAMLAEVCRVTAMEERTPILAICNATRQLGILIGPIFQILLSNFHFKIGNIIEIDPLNAPGLFMAVLWILFAFATMFMFYNLTAEINEMDRQRREALLRNHPPLSPLAHRTSLSVYGAFEDSHASLHSQSVNFTDETGPPTRRPTTRRQSVSERFLNSLAVTGNRTTAEINLMHASGVTLTGQGSRYLMEFMTETFIVMLAMVFTLFFCQVGVETVIPVVMKEKFHYGDFENSLVYMAGGLEALIVFFGVALLSRYIRDTTLQVVGWIIMLMAQVWLMVVTPWFEPGNYYHLSYYMFGIFLLYLGYPIASVANTGLYSKCLSNETQGLGQGLRRLASYVGLIFGPSWSGSTVRKPYLSFGVPVGIMLINAAMLADCYRSLVDIENKQRADAAEKNSQEDDESRSLLST